MSSQNPERRLWFSIDIVAYGKLSVPETGKTQGVLTDLLERATDRAGLHMDQWDTQVAGDGLIAALPQSEREARVVDDFIRHLSELLRQHNVRMERDAHLRLRVAIDHGPYEKAANGWSGVAPRIVARLEGSQVLRGALARNPTADIAVLLSDRVYKDVVAAGTTSLSENLFEAVMAEGKAGEDPIPARLWIPLAPGPMRARMPAEAVRTVKAAVVVLLAVIALLSWLALRDRGPTQPTAQVRIAQRAPYRNGDDLQADLVTSRPMSKLTTHEMQLVVSNHVPSQTLCIFHTRVTTTVVENGVRTAHGVLRNGSVLAIPLGAADTSANISLAVSTDKGCEMEIGFEDITPTN